MPQSEESPRSAQNSNLLPITNSQFPTINCQLSTVNYQGLTDRTDQFPCPSRK
ncbi:MAG: hypothetical protein HC849_30725 [Oscillatoriales cyanobacterium RU_3_3]|nr:hypothetical protein [Oscillatoriales cyanobacterium RU_3_3]